MKDPRHIRNEIGRVASELGLSALEDSSRLFRRWPELVGADIAGKCSPVSLNAGVLTVQTNSGPWAGQLKYLTSEMVHRINSRMGNQLVKSIQVKVSHPSSRSPKDATSAGSRRRFDGSDQTSRGSRRPSAGPGLDQALSDVAKIPDAEVSQAARRALLAAKTRSGGGSGVIKSSGASEGSKGPRDNPRDGRR